MPPIQIWPFDKAPINYQYSMGGDEDWVAYVPMEYKNEYGELTWIPFLEDNHFGNIVHSRPLANGGVLLVSCHA